MAIPGQKQPAVHREEMSSLDECIGAAHAVLQKAEEMQKLMQAGCIVVPNPTEEH